MLRLPGLIDPHVHLRTPGEEYKEDFTTGTKAALAGGFTTIIDMPNNVDSITTKEKLLSKIALAKNQIFCDVGFYFGTLGNNLEEFSTISNRVKGLKVYLNQTTGNLIIDASIFQKICEAWPIGKPILVHAEDDILPEVLRISKKNHQRLHVCHVSSEKELSLILRAKENRQDVTCGVTPHHLFLTNKDAKALENFAFVKPALRSQNDQDFLWKHLRDIDVIESDHAPHTVKEKLSHTPAYGIPGLETTLPLLFTAMHEHKLYLEDIIRLCHTNPSKIFNIPIQNDTYVEVNETKEWILQNDMLFTKSKWSPFARRKFFGKVEKILLRGSIVFQNGTVLTKTREGNILN